MNTDVGISVLVVRYGDHLLKSLVASLVASVTTRFSGLELLIWNNGPDSLCLERDIGIPFRIYQDEESEVVNHFHSKAINLLSHRAKGKYLFITQPDSILDKYCLDRLIEYSERDDSIMVEARQVPIDHHKVFDSRTLETSWVSGAGFMVSKGRFMTLGGFADALPMYCNDVDLSWRNLAMGGRNIFNPRAFFLHPKTVDHRGWPRSSEYAERHMLLGMLLLAHRWRRQDLLNDVSENILSSEDQLLHDQLITYWTAIRKGNGHSRLPKNIARYENFIGFSPGLVRYESLTLSISCR